MMRSNYMATEVKFENLDGKNYTVQVDGNTYHWYGNSDPEYQDDGVLDISYFELYDEDDDAAEMVLAFYRREDVDPESISEWGDEYDGDNPVVLRFT